MMTRLLILITSAAVALGAAGALAPRLAAAQVQLQPAQPAAGQPQPAQVQPAQPGLQNPTLQPAPGERAPRVTVLKRAPHSDRIESNGKGMALLFWAFALVTIGGALFVVTRRNLIAAVMGMVGSFMGIAAVYMMLYASFLSVIQMLVYAGAIMVLFVFVIMILNRPEDEPVAPSGRAGQILGGAAMLYLVGRLVMTLINVQAPESALAPPAPVTVPGTAIQHEWGSVKAVGTDLFGPGLFPFEAISILLLVAVVGAIAIARPLHEDPEPEGDAGAAP
ncbi:MAG TPA: NADH-quinone oxidoreductase subunit J [Kofleriaceae bacterium]|nr:NADH-quinone oxidoreductase subunit J [Kofleriaceae bacterium]